MSQSGDDTGKISITEYQQVCQKEYDDDLEKYSTEIAKLASYMANANELAKNKSLLYKRRQEYVKRKFQIADKVVYLSRNLRSLRRIKLNNYKFGNVAHSTGQAIKPANDFERKTYLEADLAAFEETKDILDNHISYLEDSIKTVSDMIFGIPYIIQLEDFRKMIK